jgi:hypothetical protein
LGVSGRSGGLAAVLSCRRSINLGVVRGLLRMICRVLYLMSSLF